jgi:hypothetical protein
LGFFYNKLPIAKQLNEHYMNLTNDVSNKSHYVYSDQPKLEEGECTYRGTIPKSPRPKNFEPYIPGIPN